MRVLCDSLLAFAGKTTKIVQTGNFPRCLFYFSAAKYRLLCILFIADRNYYAIIRLFVQKLTTLWGYAEQERLALIGTSNKNVKIVYAVVSRSEPMVKLSVYSHVERR